MDVTLIRVDQQDLARFGFKKETKKTPVKRPTKTTMANVHESLIYGTHLLLVTGTQTNTRSSFGTLAMHVGV